MHGCRECTGHGTKRATSAGSSSLITSRRVQHHLLCGQTLHTWQRSSVVTELTKEPDLEDKHGCHGCLMGARNSYKVVGCQVNSKGEVGCFLLFTAPVPSGQKRERKISIARTMFPQRAQFEQQRFLGQARPTLLYQSLPRNRPQSPSAATGCIDSQLNATECLGRSCGASWTASGALVCNSPALGIARLRLGRC